MSSLSTRDKLVTALGAILVVGFAAVNFASYFVSGHSVREALIHNELPLTSNNIYSEIQASLLRPIYVSSLMANDTFLRDWMLDGEQDIEKVTKYLHQIRERYGVFSTFVISDLTRRYYHFDGVLKKVSPEAAKDSWFFSMRTHPNGYRVDVDRNEADKNQLTIFINHKLQDYEGNFIGVTGLGLNAVSVSELIQRYKRMYQREIYFVDRQGMVKSHGDGLQIDTANIRTLPGISTVADTLLQGAGGFLEYDGANGNILLTYRFIPELDWYLLVEQSERSALAPIRRALYFNLAVSAVVTAIVLLLSARTINRYQSRLERMARTDKLTGLINRQYFDVTFEHALHRSARTGQPLSLVMFDIDWFKRINDRFGHLAGDRVIRAVADAARDSVRGSDVVARWGGDEFTVLLPDCTVEDARKIVEKLCAKVRKNVEMPGNHPITLSAGLAQFRQGDTYESLLDRADDGLYHAKRNGRDLIWVSDGAARTARDSHTRRQ